MGRWDHDDPRDEHDINELRNYVDRGGRPQFVGGSKRSGCKLWALFLLGSVSTVAYGAYELVGAL